VMRRIIFRSDFEKRGNIRRKPIQYNQIDPAPVE
jgi:hypothetical protein